MLTLSSSTQVYVVAGVTDMRRGFNGLAAIVMGELDLDLLSGHFFVFSNRRRNRVKVMYFDGSGLWVCAKRLEKGTFRWPEPGTDVVEMTSEELMLLLGGIDLSATRKRRWYGRERTKRAM
jgi:transposase